MNWKMSENSIMTWWQTGNNSSIILPRRARLRRRQQLTGNCFVRYLFRILASRLYILSDHNQYEMALTMKNSFGVREPFEGSVRAIGAFPKQDYQLNFRTLAHSQIRYLGYSWKPWYAKHAIL